MNGNAVVGAVWLNFALALLAGSLTLQASSALAWSGIGHEVVALIAERHLDPEVKQKVGELLASEGKTSIVEVARWADRIRDLKVGTQPSHLVRLGLNFSRYDPAINCKGNRCIVGALEQSIAALRQPDLALEAQVAALKYIVHFVGDIHQPLHASADPGVFKVSLRGKEMSFHDVWDSAFILDQQMSARSLAEVIDKSQLDTPPVGSPAEWAIESRDISRDVLFPELEDRTPGVALALPDDYLDSHWSIARTRLKTAGIRLARLLNELYDQ